MLVALPLELVLLLLALTLQLFAHLLQLFPFLPRRLFAGIELAFLLLDLGLAPTLLLQEPLLLGRDAGGLLRTGHVRARRRLLPLARRARPRGATRRESERAVVGVESHAELAVLPGTDDVCLGHGEHGLVVVDLPSPLKSPRRLAAVEVRKLRDALHGALVLRGQDHLPRHMVTRASHVARFADVDPKARLWCSHGTGHSALAGRAAA
mmetsp:Transcript_47082/g.131320  ORF Transcript_47082/g.131320 Transcript_47082/m.131320 type:complete len:209 (+) Transcript_47082:1179-1805(+)